MQPFDILEGIAASLIEDDINTDQIAPLGAAALMNPDYAQMLFRRRLKGNDGLEDPGFFLNNPQFHTPSILVTGANFGCGSSREAAVWCLQAVGIRCVVARSFADSFRENSLQNGLLPVVLAPDDSEAFEAIVLSVDGRARMRVDLRAQSIFTPDGKVFKFDLPVADRTRLLEGLDDIGLTMKHDSEIEAFEKDLARQRPWLQRVEVP